MYSVIGFVFPVVMVACVFLGSVFIILGLVGRVVLSAPQCAKCRFDLRRSDGVYERCPECGVDLDGGRRVRYGKRERRPRLTVLGFAILLGGPLVTLLVGRAITMQLRQQVATANAGGIITPFNLRSLSSEQLVPKLSEQWDQPWVWQEIERRRVAGTISDVQVTSAITGAVRAMERAEASFDRTVSFMAYGKAERVAWREAGLISDDLDEQLFFTTVAPDVSAFGRANAEDELTFTIRSMRGDDALIALRAITLDDGTTLPFTCTRHSSDGVALAHMGVHGDVTMNVPTGEHTLSFEVTVGRLDRMAADAYTRSPIPTPDAWADDVVRRELTVTTSVNVLPAGAPLVATTTDPGFAAAVRSALRPEGVSAMRRAFGTTLRVIRADSTQARRQLPTAIAVEVIVRSGDQAWHLADLRLGAGSGSSSFHTVNAQSLDAETVDVIYRVNPDLATGLKLEEGDTIWGEDVVFEDVPVSWFGK